MSGSNNQPSGENRQGSRQQAQGGGQQANRQDHQDQQGQRGGRGGGAGQQQYSGGGQGAPQTGAQGGQQGYRGPPGGGGGYGSGGGLGSPVGQKYLAGIVGSLLVLGVALGLMVVLVSAISGPALVEDTDQELSDQEQENRQNNFVGSHIQIGIYAGPYVALAVVALIGLLAGANLPGSVTDKAAVAVVGAAIGTALFVGVSDFILSTQYPEATDENLVTDMTLEFANVATTAIATAVVAALVSAVGVVLGDQIDASGGSL